MTTWQKYPLEEIPQSYKVTRDSLLFTTQFPALPDTHLIDLGRMKG